MFSIKLDCSVCLEQGTAQTRIGREQKDFTTLPNRRRKGAISTSVPPSSGRSSSPTKYVIKFGKCSE